MTTKELIRLLKEADPKGLKHVVDSHYERITMVRAVDNHQNILVIAIGLKYLGGEL